MPSESALIEPSRVSIPLRNEVADVPLRLTADWNSLGFCVVQAKVGNQHTPVLFRLGQHVTHAPLSFPVGRGIRARVNRLEPRCASEALATDPDQYAEMSVTLRGGRGVTEELRLCLRRDTTLGDLLQVETTGHWEQRVFRARPARSGRRRIGFRVDHSGPHLSFVGQVERSRAGRLQRLKLRERRDGSGEFVFSDDERTCRTTHARSLRPNRRIAYDCSRSHSGLQLALGDGRESLALVVEESVDCYDRLRLRCLGSWATLFSPESPLDWFEDYNCYDSTADDEGNNRLRALCRELGYGDLV